MKHPTPEAWMAYLYPESPPTSDPLRAEAETHLVACAECRQQLRQWRGILGILDEDIVSEARRPVEVAAILPMLTARSAGVTDGRVRWPWALAAGVLIAAAFLAGRALGPSRAEFERELARTRTELTREITAELRGAHQRDLADVVAATVNATAAGERELATRLLTHFNEARLVDRREFINAMDRLDLRRADEVTQLRDGFRTLAEKTGGAFRETDTRLNALASSLPVRADLDVP